jgi:hypothetical protein
MIAWTIPAEKSTTGYTAISSSTISGSTESGVLAGGVTDTLSVTFSSSSINIRYTSEEPSQTTLYTSTASSSFSLRRRTAGETLNQSGTGSFTSNVISAQTESVQTSTTTNVERQVVFTEPGTGLSTAWTTVYDAEVSATFFEVTEVEATSANLVYALTEVTEDTTTLLAQTQTFGERATVVQANTKFATNADIIYVINPPDNWSGFSVASQQATSGTRFTISPSYSTQQSPLVDGTINPTQSAVNAVVSSTISWSASQATQSARIMPFGNFTGVNVVSVPLPTQETLGGALTTK